MHNLTFEKLDNLLDARNILMSLKKDTTGAEEAIIFIDIVLEEIFPGWKEHLKDV